MHAFGEAVITMITGGKAQKVFAGKLREAILGARDILEIGTPQRYAKELRPFEGLFAGLHYVAAGYQPSLTYGKYNCDCHQDIQAMTFPDAAFDTVLCIEVIEHVANPFAAASELFRVLRPAGRLFLTTPFLLQYHGKKAEAHSPDHESYPDFWRFTHQGLQELLGHFRRVEIHPLDGPVEFRLNQFYLTTAMSFPLLRYLLDAFDRPRVGKATTRHLVLATK